MLRKAKLPFWSSPLRRGKTPDGVPAICVDVASSRSERHSDKCTTVYLTEIEVTEAVKAGKRPSLLLAMKVANAARALLTSRADAEAPHRSDDGAARGDRACLTSLEAEGAAAISPGR